MSRRNPNPTYRDDKQLFEAYVDTCIQTFLDETHLWPEPIPQGRRASVLYRPHTRVLKVKHGDIQTDFDQVVAGKPDADPAIWVYRPTGWSKDIHLGYDLGLISLANAITRECRRRELVYKVVDFELGEDIDTTHFARLFESL